MLVFASDASGKIVSISNVKNGKACNCFCIACNDPLIARNGGKIKAHSFAHTTKEESRTCLMTALHRYAQEYFLTAKTINLPAITISHRGYSKTEPSRKALIKSAKLEYSIHNKYIADVKLETDVGDLLVEIKVTSPCSAEKINFYCEKKIASLEYDLSVYIDSDYADLNCALKHNDDTSNWLFGWCEDQLREEINQKVELNQIEMNKKIRQQIEESRQRALRKFNNLKKRQQLKIPSHSIEFNHNINGKNYDLSAQVVKSKSIKFEKVSLEVEHEHFLLLKCIAFNKSNQERVLNIALLFQHDIPDILKKESGQIIVGRIKKSKHFKFEWLNFTPPRSALERAKLTAITEKEKQLEKYKFIEQVTNYADIYASEQDRYFSNDYPKWKIWLASQSDMTPNENFNVKNPKYPALLKTNNTHPQLWMFDRWYILIFSKLAEFIDSYPIGTPIDTKYIFELLKNEFPLSHNYKFFVEQADKMNVSYKLEHLLKPESIINTCLSFFEETLAVEKISGVFFRNYNLRLQMSPAIK
ncbi:MAG: hypothetical protein MK175_18305 [Pseudoalteromonas sp.]|uniref:hypothetical protein n=1 Tax=Pseudoalteromonas sp. TaxID=53249 RepID=UPI0025F77ECC|nr:hypothetical protein [Pseudoalteromonas sp.]MCH2089140.1 hypothetical protein [Pseudoalteromonas sp.]